MLRGPRSNFCLVQSYIPYSQNLPCIYLIELYFLVNSVALVTAHLVIEFATKCYRAANTNAGLGAIMGFVILAEKSKKFHANVV